MRTRLPFPLLGIDSDNGSEFINDMLFRYCIAEEITFTRSRAYEKNDQAATPYRRVLASEDVAFEDKARLSNLYVQLNPVTLRNQIDLNVGKLWKIIK